jgi:hypothetical protein
MLCNFGQEWEVAELHTRTPYKVGFRGEIHAEITLKIGLRSINVTLVGVPVIQKLGKANETINYNERFSWANEGWEEGRLGFGPLSGRLNQEFRAAQYKGLPYPILWIAEYFTIDGEGIRWGRFYRQAGFYSHVMCWLAFALWLFFLCVSHMVVRYSAFASLLTGCALLAANLIFTFVRNPTKLHIPFEDGPLELRWGWCFWLCLGTGGACVLLGIVILIVEKCCFSLFYSGTDLSDYEEYFTFENEGPRLGGIELETTDKMGDPLDAEESFSDEDYIYENPEPIVRAFRNKSNANPWRSSSGPSSPLGLPRSIRRKKPQEKYMQDVHENPVFIDDDVGIGRAVSIMPPGLKETAKSPGKGGGRNPVKNPSQNVAMGTIPIPTSIPAMDPARVPKK